MTGALATAFMPLAELERHMRESDASLAPIQAAELQRALDTAWRDVPFYQALLRDRRGDVRQPPATVADWPVWRVADMRRDIEQHPPYGSLYTATGLAQLDWVHSSTGTTGTPRLICECSIDRERTTAIYRRFAEFRGITARDIVCITGSYGLPRGAWSQTRAARSVGAAVVPLSSGRITPSDKAVQVIVAVGATVVAGAGSYLSHLADRAAAAGIDLAASQVTKLWVSGEAAPAPRRRHLQSVWRAQTTMAYATTDVGWIAIECDCSAAEYGELGMHVFEDAAIVEIVDPDGQPVPDGEYGEVVVTSWARPSTPRIRFGTGDCGAIIRGRCECGRYGPRLLPLRGRTDDAIRFRNTTIWPSAVEAVITDTLGQPTDYLLDAREVGSGGALVVCVAEDAGQSLPVAALTDALRARLGVAVRVSAEETARVVEFTGTAQEMKPRRVRYR